MFSQKLKDLRREKKVSQEAVADYLDISKSAYGYYESGRNMPSVEILLGLAKYFDVSTDDLLDRNVASIYHKSEELTPAIRINVLGRVPAGVPVEAVEDIIDWEELDPREYDANRDYFGLLVTGESMSPKYLDGDIVIIEQTEDADSGKDVIAYVNGQDATLKRLVKYGNGNVELKPLNPAYQTMTFTPGEIEATPVKIIGIVKELRRKI